MIQTQDAAANIQFANTFKNDKEQAQCKLAILQSMPISFPRKAVRSCSLSVPEHLRWLRLSFLLLHLFRVAQPVLVSRRGDFVCYILSFILVGGELLQRDARD